MIGIRTTGNATLIAYDEKPILVTDPWLGEEDAAYFGSWNLAYKISEDIKKEIQSAEYVWFSHGHPDHLNPSSYK
jgi:L-ascorbate metabolism protein UlaG (beta-lactamase superfamily)